MSNFGAPGGQGEPKGAPIEPKGSPKAPRVPRGMPKGPQREPFLHNLLSYCLASFLDLCLVGFGVVLGAVLHNFG